MAPYGMAEDGRKLTLFSWEMIDKSEQKKKRGDAMPFSIEYLSHCLCLCLRLCVLSHTLYVIYACFSAPCTYIHIYGHT